MSHIGHVRQAREIAFLELRTSEVISGYHSTRNAICENLGPLITSLRYCYEHPFHTTFLNCIGQDQVQSLGAPSDVAI